jgi:hypothetical protein
LLTDNFPLFLVLGLGYTTQISNVENYCRAALAELSTSAGSLTSTMTTNTNVVGATPTVGPSATSSAYKDESSLFVIVSLLIACTGLFLA